MFEATQPNPNARRRNRRRTGLAVGACAAVAAIAIAGCSSGSSGNTSPGSSSGAATGLKSLTVGLPAPSISASSTNYAIGQYLGCYKRYGYDMTISVVTNPAQQLAAFNRGSIDIGTGGSDQFMSELHTIGTAGAATLPLKAFYELGYPFKYGLAVQPGSDITALSQLEGKTVGVDVLSDSSATALKALLSENGLDPNGVKIIATGLGAASGQALKIGRVAALFSSDTVYGTILQAGIDLRFITVDGKPPYLNVSGVIAYANTKKVDPAAVAAFERCSTEGTIFTAENPAAAAYIMLKTYPALGKTGASLTEQIQNLALPIRLRAKLLTNPDTKAATPYGLMSQDEFVQNQKILSSPAMDTSTIFSNDTVPVLTAAEIATVKKQADDFKIPGITAPISLAALPANAP